MYKSFEFLIRFSNFDRTDLARCVARLPRQPDGRSQQPHIDIRLEQDGIYFHDLQHSDFSARMLRIVIELAAEHSEVQIEGFGSGGYLSAEQLGAYGLADFGKELKAYRAERPSAESAG
jgi:hypothetical protein